MASYVLLTFSNAALSFLEIIEILGMTEFFLSEENQSGAEENPQSFPFNRNSLILQKELDASGYQSVDIYLCSEKFWDQ